MISINSDKYVLEVKADGTCTYVFNGASFTTDSGVGYFTFETKEEMLQYVADNKLTLQGEENETT